MEKFYEIIMKNGLSLIVFTNKNGFCEFSINGNEFIIFSSRGLNNEMVNLSVSADREVFPGAEQTEVLIDHDYTVLSIRTLNLRKLKGSKRQEIENVKELRSTKGEHKKSCVTGDHVFICAQKGGVKTPFGWLFGEA